MKTRIISAAVLIGIVIAVLTIGKLWWSPLITILIALICAMGIYEFLHNAVKLESNVFCIISSVYGALMIFLLDGYLSEAISFPYLTSSYIDPERMSFYDLWIRSPLLVTILYFLATVAIILFYHDKFDLKKIVSFTAFPIFIVYGFASLNSIIYEGIYYLLLLINFASICDTGAYFVGSFFGKNKLCPSISPKKTIEGALGGIASSIVVSLILVLAFGHGHIFTTLLFTIPFCVIGMIGDLFASIIKRNAGIKDYADLIPGHGGILDRFDSMLMIAPLLYIFIQFKFV